MRSASLDESFKDAPVPERPKRSRRSWSDDEKQRIIALALAPGASVADIARQHGLNANLLFNWVRSARGLSAVGASRQLAASAYPPAEPEMGSPIALEILERIAALFAVESSISGRSPDARVAIRYEHAGTRLVQLKAYLETALARISSKSDLAAAIDAAICLRLQILI
jgi:transposase-like protein